VNAALELVQRLGAGRLAAMGAVTLALVGFFGFVMLRVSQPALGVLYTDLSIQDATAIQRDLDARGVRYEMRGDSGQTILAPRQDLARLRMELAGKGLPNVGGVGYEIFDKGDAFSSTSFVQNVNHLRALEGELARTIRSIGRVQGARVHLVLPEKRLFTRDKEPPSASIALKLAGDLDAGQIRAIRHLAASAVEGLKPERVSIVDERGRLLADGARGEDAAGVGLEERQVGIERRLRSQLEEIVAGVVGAGRARVQVTADLDVNRVESRSETYDPESRVVRSTQTRNENATTAAEEKGVSVGNELPGANATPAAPGPKDASTKNEETTNYEISRTTRTEVLESGRVKRLSVAVLVDGAYTRDGRGAPAYQPRSQEELDRITALVRTAIGFDKARGDQVEVVNLRFADPPQVPEIEKESLLTSLFAPTKEDVLRYIELAVLAVLTLIVVLTVVRPLLKRALGPEPGRLVAAAVGAGAAALPGAAAGEALLTSGMSSKEAIQVAARDSRAAQFLEAAKLNGQIQAETVERVVGMVKSNPAETVEVIRSWIQEG
jgi:flagellar M-ring protein FliF